MGNAPAEDVQDALRWWQARVLAEDDQADELRERAAAGDDHARRELARLLSERQRPEEAIEAIRPLADAGDDVAEAWLARWLADEDRLDELRQRAARGSDHAVRELARRLAERGMAGELGDLAAAADADGLRLILRGAGQASRHWTDVLQVRADLGDDSVRSSLARLLAREGRLDEPRERAAAGDRYAQYCLTEHPDDP